MSAATTPTGPGGLGGEITTVADLARQAETADVLLEQLELMTKIPREWALELPERLAEAKWAVADVTRAAAQVSESLDDLSALAEAVASLRKAITNTAGAGELAAVQRAYGQTEGLIRG